MSTIFRPEEGRHQDDAPNRLQVPMARLMVLAFAVRQLPGCRDNLPPAAMMPGTIPVMGTCYGFSARSCY